LLFSLKREQIGLADTAKSFIGEGGKEKSPPYAMVYDEAFAAFRKSGLPSGCFLVLVAMLYYWRGDYAKPVFPGLQSLQERTGLSRRQIIKLRKRLETAGLITRDWVKGQRTPRFYFTFG